MTSARLRCFLGLMVSGSRTGSDISMLKFTIGSILVERLSGLINAEIRVFEHS